MPICVVCKSFFPLRVKINDKWRNLKSRKRCLVCSPFGLHNTTSAFVDCDRRKKQAKYCKYCGKELDRTKIKKGACCFSCRSNRRRYMKKVKMIEYKGGKCIKCGYHKCMSALTFHHRNPVEKEFDISGNHCYTWEKLKRELDKCDLVCRNCHAEIEYKLPEWFLKEYSDTICAGGEIGYSQSSYTRPVVGSNPTRRTNMKKKK